MCFYLRYRLLLPGHVPYIFFLLSILLSQTQIPPKHKLVLFDNFDFLFSVCRYWRQRQKPALNFPSRFKTKKKTTLFFFSFFHFWLSGNKKRAARTSDQTAFIVKLTSPQVFWLKFCRVWGKVFVPLQFSEALFEELFCYIDAFEKTDEKWMMCVFFYLFRFRFLKQKLKSSKIK